LPVTLFNNSDTSLLGTNPNGVNNNYLDEPNFTPGALEINTNPRKRQLAFNTSLFHLPALGDLGNSPRRFFYGPGISNFDVALLKIVQLTESKSFQIRLEAFNVFNHAPVLRTILGEREYWQPQLWAGCKRGGATDSAAWREILF